MRVFSGTEGYTFLIILAVPMLKTCSNKEETMKSIEEMAIRYEGNSQEMLEQLKIMKKSLNNK